jgi:hypothetical protein
LTRSFQALKFGWNSVFTPDTSNNGSFNVSPQTVEALIDRARGVAVTSELTVAETNRNFLEEQQCSVSSFNIDQPLVSTHLLNGHVLDCTTAEDDVQAIAASWNESRYASRVADAAPIYARCNLLSFDFFVYFLSHECAASRCRATGPMMMFAWLVVMAVSYSCATCALLRIISSALGLRRFALSPTYISVIMSVSTRA